MSNHNWNELDGFDLEYEKYKDKDFLSGSLDACKSRLQGKSIVKIYITIYKDSNASDTSAFIDYIKIGDEIISFEPLEKEDVKDGPASATPGGLMTYTITYGNNELEPADLIVKEDYDPRTVFIESYPPPDPGTTNTWTFPNLPPGAHGQIIIKMRSRKPAARASIDGHVSGRGFASTEGMLSTEFESYLVTNNVHITAGEFNFSASATTRIRPIIGSAPAIRRAWSRRLSGRGATDIQFGQHHRRAQHPCRIALLPLSTSPEIDHSPERGLVCKTAGGERLQRHSLER